MEKLDSRCSAGTYEWYPHNMPTNPWYCPGYYAARCPYYSYATSPQPQPHIYGTGIEVQPPWSSDWMVYGQSFNYSGDVHVSTNAQAILPEVPPVPAMSKNGIRRNKPEKASSGEPGPEQQWQVGRGKNSTTSFDRYVYKRHVPRANSSCGSGQSRKAKGRSNVLNWRNPIVESPRVLLLHVDQM